MKRACLFVLLFSGVAYAPLHAADTQWKHLNNKDEVRALFRQESKLWIGTNGGLVIYDLSKDEFVEEHLLGENLPSSSIWSIEGSENSIYIGSDAGLSIYEDGAFRTYHSGGAASLRHVRSIDFGALGDICVGTYGYGAGVIHRGELSMVTRVDSLLDDRVYAVIQLNDTTYYYATSYGVCSFKDSLWGNYRVGAGLTKGEALDLILTEDNAMYALIAGGGVFYFDGTRGRRLSTDGLFLDNEIAAVALEKDQTLWAAGRFGGIKKYRSGSWHYVGDGKDENIKQAQWRSAYASPEGRVFFGAMNGLVVSVYQNKIRKMTVPSALPSNNIHCMVEDSTGRRFFAAGKHLFFIPADNGDYVRESLAGPVTAMTVSPLGEFYCSTRWGVFRKSGGLFEEIPLDHGGRIAVVTAMTFDREGHLWVGTDTGEVLKFDGSLWLCLGERDELTGGEVAAIVQDEFGTVWVFSPQTGVTRFEGHGWKKIPLEIFKGQILADIIVAAGGRPMIASTDSLWQYQGRESWNAVDSPILRPGVQFTALHYDKMDRLYAGTTEGLLLADGKSSRYIQPRTGLAGKNVSSLLVDRKGILWVGFRGDGISYIQAERLW
jgi:ligand-binding sensor domain-containing protein